ncbi:MAG: hypothetical protein J6W82_11485 [Bacteroidales bacterium]|nr:hypothetical protein [Bacteroidales bacterium]
MMHILRVAAVLLMAWPFASCERTLVEGLPELSVSIHIPDMGTTKAETGSVGATDSEKKFTSLKLWVFLHGGANDGQLVGYRGFTSEELLADTGLQHSTITRFGMPLTWDMLNALTKDDARVDVYALANAVSATDIALGEGTERSELDAIVMSGATFGASPLTMAVPADGLPMSGVLKKAPVTGDYPVLNVSTVTLTRAVSKIRFVFSQQGKTSSSTGDLVPSNTSCVIKSITFGGTSEGHDCQIAASEKLFTDKNFEIDGYTPLEATLAGKDTNPLMGNADIAVCTHPEDLLFRSAGHTSESAQEYEDRLGAAVAASSQLGPIYIRETDKLISGTIVYNVGEGDVEATFSMPSDDALTRNHSWILYAYFSETTKTLQFKIVVLPWDKTTYDFDFKNWTVNVIRRFTIPETDPLTFTKIQNANGYYDIYYWPILGDQPNVVKGDILIDAPVGQTIHIVPVAGVRPNYTQMDDIFSISPMEHIIYPNYANPEDGRSEDCRIEFEFSCNTDGLDDLDVLEGNYIDLHFCVEIVDGDKVRWIDLDSESIDYYRIYLKKNWTEGEKNWSK